jgi:hypothetical protein
MSDVRFEEDIMRRILSLVALITLAGCVSAAVPGSDQQPREVQGATTVSTIIEDFDRGPTTVQLQRRIDRWGERVVSSRGTVNVVESGAPERGKAARFGFEASFDEPFSPRRWADSGLAFIARADLDPPPAGSTGVCFSMKPEGFTRIELYLVQDSGGSARTWYLPLFANDGQWKDWKIPFQAFVPTDATPALDLSRPISVEAYVPYQENWQAWHFRTGTEAGCALLLDDIGSWKSKAPDQGGMLESADGERDRMPLVVTLEGSSLWNDYSKSEQGETAINPGVKGQRLSLTQPTGGPEGSFFSLDGRLELDPAIASYHKAGQALTVFIKAPLGRAVTGSRAFSFLARSTVATSGSIELQDSANDRYYAGSFSLMESWSKVRIPFERLVAGEQSLAVAGRVSDRLELQLAFELPPDEVQRAAQKGFLEFSIGLDSFALEP